VGVEGGSVPWGDRGWGGAHGKSGRSFPKNEGGGGEKKKESLNKQQKNVGGMIPHRMEKITKFGKGGKKVTKLKKATSKPAIRAFEREVTTRAEGI